MRKFPLAAGLRSRAAAIGIDAKPTAPVTDTEKRKEEKHYEEKG